MQNALREIGFGQRWWSRRNSRLQHSESKGTDGVASGWRREVTLKLDLRLCRKQKRRAVLMRQ